MPEKETIERAQEDAREGKSPSTQAGEFVREEYAPHSRGQPRCEFHQTSYRDRPLEGAARWCQAAATQWRKGFRQNQ